MQDECWLYTIAFKHDIQNYSKHVPSVVHWSSARRAIYIYYPEKIPDWVYCCLYLPLLVQCWRTCSFTIALNNLPFWAVKAFLVVLFLVSCRFMFLHLPCNLLMASGKVNIFVFVFLFPLYLPNVLYWFSFSMSVFGSCSSEVQSSYENFCSFV